MLLFQSGVASRHSSTFLRNSARTEDALIDDAGHVGCHDALHQTRQRVVDQLREIACFAKVSDAVRELVLQDHRFRWNLFCDQRVIRSWMGLTKIVERAAAKMTGPSLEPLP